jgi:hypothetical protein
MQLKADLDVQQTHLFVEQMLSFLVPALGVTKSKIARGMLMIALCRPT